jgi:short-chain fatty acids transporter
MNIIDQLAHRTYSLQQTLLTPYNLVAVAAMGVLMPVLFWRIHLPVSEKVPALANAPASPQPPIDVAVPVVVPERTPAEKIEQSPLITVLLVLLALDYLYNRIAAGTFSLDLNMMIFLLLVLGWILHGTPIRYMRAFHDGGRAAGPLLLAYPLYGGILGLIRDTGLADWFAQLFVSFSSAHTLPFWSYISSNVITLFVPSGGGHWAVQGPVMVKAALQLNASLPNTAMAVAFGEQAANLVQPFWALPIVSIGGVNVREMMGYCLLALGIAFPIFALALLLF